MYWQSLLYLFFVTLTTGMLIDLCVRDWRADWLEKAVMRFGVGLAAMSVAGVVLNLLHIPLDYRVFLGLGLAIALCALVRNRRLRRFDAKRIGDAWRRSWRRSWRSRPFWHALVMLVLFLVTLKMLMGGAFNYDYFEDGDPWGYAVVVDYIAENRTFSVPYYSVQYSEPYTQGYQIVMGVLSQTNDSVYWTMKFFSTLIYSFGVLFIYYFSRRFSGSEEIALLAGLFLFAVPAWVSHFIFSLHYNMTLFIVLLYVLAQLMHARQDDRGRGNDESIAPDSAASGAAIADRVEGWLPVGIVVFASLFVNHLSTALHASLFCGVLVVTRILAEKRIDWQTIAVFVGGFALSLLYFVPAYANHWWLNESKFLLGGMKKFFPMMRFIITPTGMISLIILLAGVALIFRYRSAWQAPFETWLQLRNRGLIVWLGGLLLVMIVLLQPVPLIKTFGTADRFYGPSDFFGAKAENMINNPVGLGPVLMTAVVVSFLVASARITKLFEPANAWIAVSYAWILSAFLLVLGKYFSIAISPFRVWTFLGFFASLFAAWGVVALVRMFTANSWVCTTVTVLLTIVIIPTTFVPKYQFNTTMIWKDTTIGVPESRELFTWMREGGIPKNSVVAHLCGDSEFLSGYDMNPPVWDKVFHPKRGVEPPYFVAQPLDITPEAYIVLKNAKVEYVTIGASCFWQAPRPPEQEEAYGFLLREKIEGFQADVRLVLIKDTGIERLYKLY